MTENAIFIERIVQDAADDGADATLRDRFRNVAAELAPFVPESEDVQYAAFYFENEASIAIQSFKTDRQVDFNLTTDPITVHTIDERNRHSENEGRCITDIVRWCIEG